MDGTTDIGANGILLAEALATKVRETIEGFPSFTAGERPAMAELVAARLTKWAEETRASDGRQ